MSFSTFTSTFADKEVLSNETIVTLHKAYKQGDRNAYETIVSHNMRLVFKIANDYTGYGKDLQDIASDGTKGLLSAIEKFDSEKGEFSQYASRRIKKYITMGFDKGKLVKTKRYAKMTKEERENDIVESLNEKIGDSCETEFADNLADERDNQAEQLEHDELLALMLKAIDGLEARERTIVRNHFGLNEDKKTLKEIAQKLNLTLERVRQIEAEALVKLKLQLSK